MLNRLYFKRSYVPRGGELCFKWYYLKIRAKFKIVEENIDANLKLKNSFH